MNAAELNGTSVVRSLIGTPEWAAQTYGGTWVDAGELGVGKGWSYVDGEFRSPQPYPSWSWQGQEWVPPVPHPELVAGFVWVWDEDVVNWRQVVKPEPPFV